MKEAAPLLANLKAVYDKCDIRGKHKLVKAVFQLGITFDGHRCKTPRLHPALMHNYQHTKKRVALCRATRKFWG